MQKKYEEDLRKHETDLSAAQKEKDELLQQAKNTKHEPSNKIAEQRRKRIQELEQSISELKKKMVEQQRAIKMNEKNAAQVKKLADDIRGIKAQKVVPFSLELSVLQFLPEPSMQDSYLIRFYSVKRCGLTRRN